MLKSQYESVYSTPVKEKIVSSPQEFFSHNTAEEQFNSIVIDRNDIMEALDNLSSKSAAGPDGVPNILLKNCKRSLADPLEILFRTFLSTGTIPSILKEAFVIPVHKGGERSSPANFRPVSLTSHIIKTMERIIRKSMVNHLEVHKKLNQSQHGFRSQRSCLSQLLEHHDTILSFLEEGENVDSIYLDFSKAFDKVDTGILCHKLREIGIGGKIGVWLHNFLSDRKQFIIANGVKSNQSSVKSGVPQGTVLGPVLFLILINDIDSGIESFVSLFADDTRISRKVNNEEDVETLQDDLEKLYRWQEHNNMAFNSSKFEVLRYGSNTALKESTNYLTPGCEPIIEEKENLRDLGIIMSNDASFSSHVEHVCKKVKQKSGWILRTFSSRQTWFLKFMWKSLVQGHVDYCSQLYFPNKSSDMEKIENLQRIYTRKIPEVSSLNYWERLQKLKIYSQERRMERYRVIYIWKILEGISPNCGIQETHSDRRGREVQVPKVKGNGKFQTIREGTFQIHGAKLFNSLPKSVRNITRTSVDEFKVALDKFLQTIPDEPKLPGYIPSACNQVTASPSNSIIDLSRVGKFRRPG